jgi:hypothetical protein
MGLHRSEPFCLSCRETDFALVTVSLGDHQTPLHLCVICLGLCVMEFREVAHDFGCSACADCSDIIDTAISGRTEPLQAALQSWQANRHSASCPFRADIGIVLRFREPWGATPRQR